MTDRDATPELLFPPLADRLLASLQAAQGDVGLERVAVEAAVAELRTFYDGNQAAELLRDGGFGHGGVGLAADDSGFERWSDLIADACGL